MTERGTADELFARLPSSTRRTLEQIGLGLPVLRRIAAEEGGERRVRHIVSEFTPSADWRDLGRDTPVWRWIRLLLVAAAGVAVCLASTYLVGPYALLVGVVCAPAVGWAGSRARASGAELVVCCLVGFSYVVLIWVGSQQADQWYLHLRGRAARVTYARPLRSESHGVSTLYCRVRLPDGSVRQVIRNDKTCTEATMVGLRTRAVVDPAGHYRPFLGGVSDLGFGFWDHLCLGAATVLVLAPLTTALVSGRSALRGRGSGRAGGATA
ncbi:hypothetical protein ABZZ74_39135 [Streptomyces sp. NPDC006476]|uniref:hypothetical protein n=1 Tax=Streptomyces sp. NPDC006476 TaxID=3157175 RepID=UPI00339F9A3D